MTGVALDALLDSDRLNQREPAWRREARLAALDWLAANPMPTAHDETWRYTPVDSVVSLLDTASRPAGIPDLDERQIDSLAGDHGTVRLVYVNGRFAAGLSRVSTAAVSACPFSDHDRSAPAGPVLEPDRLDGFAALNGAAGDDGASVWIERAVPTGSVHIVHVAAPASAETAITYPCCVIRLDPGSTATVVESYVGLPGSSITNASTVIEVEEGASLTYQRVQTEPDHGTHVGKVRMRLGQDALVHAGSFTCGAEISRVAFDVTARGDRCAMELDGLYLPIGNDRHDHFVVVEHLGSHTTSTQRFRGVIDNRARGSFTGQIVVRPGTVDTSAHQTSHSLLLSPTAQSDARPWLEILADDVRCTHGAAFGRLDDDAVFYLRSRGIPECAARDLLEDAFIAEIADAIQPHSLRRHLESVIQTRRRGAEVAG